MRKGRERKGREEERTKEGKRGSCGEIFKVSFHQSRVRILKKLKEKKKRGFYTF